jgi:hypothetical protein
MTDVKLYHMAHIKNGVVDNISVWDKLPKHADGEYHDGFEYVDVTDTIVSVGWEYADGVFVNPNDLEQTYTVPAPEPEAE